MAMDQSKALSAIRNAAQVLKTRVQVGKQIMLLIRDVKSTIQQSSRNLAQMQLRMMFRVNVCRNLMDSLRQLADQFASVAYDQVEMVGMETVQERVSVPVGERALSALRMRLPGDRNRVFR